MDKGYYKIKGYCYAATNVVAIHNKNGQGLLPWTGVIGACWHHTVAIHNKNGQGLLLKDTNGVPCAGKSVAIHNKNGQGLLPPQQPLPTPNITCRNPQ